MSAHAPILATLNVALGGAIGAALRYHAGRAVAAVQGPQTVGAFPFATLAVNVVGSMAMGVLAGWLARGGVAHAEQWRLFAGVGLLGGFTTFSSFSLEMLMLIERGEIATAIAYAAISVLAGLAGLYLGLAMMRVAA